MTLTEALQYLDTTARVSCPEITCERAAELAEVMRDMDRTEKRHAREWSDLLGMRDYWDSRMVGLERQVEALKKERDEARREVKRLEEKLERSYEANESVRSQIGKAVSDVEVDASDYERPGKVKP